MSKYRETGTFLDEMLSNTTREVASRKAMAPLAQVDGVAREADPPRDFAAALKADPSTVAVVAEIKRATPYEGELIQAFDPVGIAQAFQAGGAAAIAVWANRMYYMGESTYISIIRPLVRLPILYKNFVVDVYQVAEARAAGADAVALLATALHTEQLDTLCDAVLDYGMTPVVEVGTGEEIAHAVEMNVPVIAINNRNVLTYEIDMVRTTSLMKSVPADIIVLSESGYAGPGLVSRVAGEAGVDAVLVGSALMVADDRAAAVKAFTGQARQAR